MKILFLCVANSARSQMAEGLARKLLGGVHEIRSAGSVPAQSVSPYAVHVMAEVGIDIASKRPKSWEELPKDFLNELDYVVTLCAEETCPTLPVKTKKLHWPLPDPVSAKSDDATLEVFRKIRDDISKRLRFFS